MLRLRDIMTTDVVSVTPETTIRQAMEVLARQHVSGAPVLAGGKLLGVVTATDLMAFASALSGVPTERESERDWNEPAVDDETGDDVETPGAFFVQLWDDAGADVTERVANTASPEWNALEEHDVSEVMTRAPLTTMAADAQVEAAADIMRNERIHRVLVTEGDELVGIVSALDIAAAAADRRFTSRTYVFDRRR